MKIELKKILYYPSMSEETSCFRAELYCDGKKIGYCRNDGHGGSTLVQPYIDFKEKFKEVEKYCKSLPDVDLGDNIKIKNNLEHVVDDLFEQWLDKKDNIKLEKDLEKGICHKGSPNELNYRVSAWKIGGKLVPLQTLLKNPNNLYHVKKYCEELKRNGRVIMNKNLPFEV